MPKSDRRVSEYRFRHKDGTYRWLRDEQVVERDEHGDATSILGNWTDITSLKEATTQEDARSAFFANLSHELRTPLTAILGFSDVMKQNLFGTLEPRYHDYSRYINDSARHLLSLINALLELAKIENGSYRLQDDRIHLPDLVDEALAVMRPIAGAGEVGLSHGIGADTPPLKGDRRLCKQIIMNLIANAVKFTGKTGEIKIETELDTDGSMCLTVVDNGYGIPKVDIENAQEAFSDTRVGTSRSEPAIGLDLPLAKAFVELHGGSLVIDSELDVGTRVAVRFPAERVVDR
jgi:signal transduction histidine kinase